MRSILLTTFCLLAALPSMAFPPAPYDTIYGTIRDQVGKTISAEGAELILLKDDVEIDRVAVLSDLWIDRNYELHIKIDANRPLTRVYDESALLAQGLYGLAVDMNGARYYPIEASAGLFSAGNGAGQTRLDLNLGIDSDGDGLPDVWEQWQLYQAGYYPDENGWPIDLIDRYGDFDHDGDSNLLEYIAGTFAGDKSESFALTIKDKTATYVQFEFYSITGKVYTLERSSDGQSWTEIPFGLTQNAERFIAHKADSVGIQSGFCAPSGERTEFFRLTVQ